MKRSVFCLYRINNMKICTWNSQGNPYTTPKKIEILNQLYNDNDVLLIQECGDIAKDLQLPDATIWAEGQAGAFNNRCTTCIISKKGGQGGTLDVSSSTGRPAIYLNVMGLNIYTLHATSGNGVPDVMNLFARAEEPFIIGGDMNCSRTAIMDNHGVAGNMTDYIFSGTRSRYGNLGRLVTSERVTHPGSGSELDFFIVSLSLKTECTRRHPVTRSDHYPVCTTIYEYGEETAARTEQSVRKLLERGNYE